MIALATALRTERQAASHRDSAAAPSATIDEARPAVPLADENGARAAAKIIGPGQSEQATGDECAAVSAAPDPWLACIATLARAGRSAAAAHELDAFRARFPDREPLPDLEALAPR